MEYQKGLERGSSSEGSNKEIEGVEVRRLLAELDEIELHMRAGIEEQGSIIRSRPETDAQYARLAALASIEAQLREREIDVLRKLKALHSN